MDSDPLGGTSEDRVVDALVSKLLNVELSLEALTPKQRQLLESSVDWDSLKSQLAKRVSVAAVDVSAKVKAFLSSYADSPQTLRTYRVCLSKFMDWSGRVGVNPLLMGRTDLVKFATWLSSAGAKPATTKKTLAVVSSWYAWLLPQLPWLQNPALGLGLPAGTGESKPLLIPSTSEIERMRRVFPPTDGAAVATLAGWGLRVGALPTLSIKDDRFQAFSKGEFVTGTLTGEVVAWIEKACLPLEAPFKGRTGPGWSRRIQYLAGLLWKAGKLQHPYSAHDLRHYFAVMDYRAYHDIYRLKDLLGHSSIGVTQRYLRSMALIVDD